MLFTKSFRLRVTTVLFRQQSVSIQHNSFIFFEINLFSFSIPVVFEQIFLFTKTQSANSQKTPELLIWGHNFEFQVHLKTSMFFWTFSITACIRAILKCPVCPLTLIKTLFWKILFTVLKKWKISSTFCFSIQLNKQWCILVTLVKTVNVVQLMVFWKTNCLIYSF